MSNLLKEEDLVPHKKLYLMEFDLLELYEITEKSPPNGGKILD